MIITFFGCIGFGHIGMIEPKNLLGRKGAAPKDEFIELAVPVGAGRFWGKPQGYTVDNLRVFKKTHRMGKHIMAGIIGTLNAVHKDFDAASGPCTGDDQVVPTV